MGKKDKNNSVKFVCEHISNREVTAQKASRDSIKYMQCLYMVDKI